MYMTYIGEILEYLQKMEVNEAVRRDMEGRDGIGSQSTYTYTLCVGCMADICTGYGIDEASTVTTSI